MVTLSEVRRTCELKELWCHALKASNLRSKWDSILSPLSFPSLTTLELAVEHPGNPYIAIIDKLVAPHLHKLKLKLPDKHVQSTLRHFGHARQIQRLDLTRAENAYDEGPTSIDLQTVMSRMRTLRTLAVQGFSLNMQGELASDGSAQVNVPELCPPTLRSIILADVEISITCLKQLLATLRRSTVWQHFEKLKVVKALSSYPIQDPLPTGPVANLNPHITLYEV